MPPSQRAFDGRGTTYPEGSEVSLQGTRRHVVYAYASWRQIQREISETFDPQAIELAAVTATLAALLIERLDELLFDANDETRKETA